ncbi:MAG: Patatin [Gallionellales bacterium GWA2_60_142]|jgi:NTE family protein|nr:MAG: Patatin [Gallionellales bacterium GWA2_60_142]HCI13366.1 Patatin [Gallionellaceae bacterium]
MSERIGLILTGGGARAAYQVGVLKAIAEYLPHRAHNPFPVICGTSSGALNAATLAVNARNFRRGVRYLTNVWKNFHTYEVYRTDAVGVFNNSMLWLAGLVLSGLGINRLKQISLLDNTPLAELLDKILPCDKIQQSIDAGLLHALSITASGYESGKSVTFYQGVPDIEPWHRTRRVGVPTNIEPKHLLASSAIPFIFPATMINREYFGDGSMRQIAPVSSALHLGATRILVISATNDALELSRRSEHGDYPSLAQIGGHALNSIFMDSMEVDLERVQTINRLVELMPEEIRRATGLKHVELLVIKPSESIDKIAERYMSELPWTIRVLLRLAGAAPHGRGSALISFLLSERKYCQALIELGYRDAQQRRDEILRFLDVSPHRDSGMPQ